MSSKNRFVEELWSHHDRTAAATIVISALALPKKNCFVGNFYHDGELKYLFEAVKPMMDRRMAQP